MCLVLCTENAESDNEPPVNHASDSSNEEFHDADTNNSNVNSVDEHDDTQNVPESKKKTQTRKRFQLRTNNTVYQRLFNENKHLFDLSCDCCSKIFESLDEARAHYSSEHNKPKGYIRTSNGRKLLFRCNVMQHLERHSNPEKFKYVCGENLYSDGTYLFEWRKNGRVIYFFQMYGMRSHFWVYT